MQEIESDNSRAGKEFGDHELAIDDAPIDLLIAVVGELLQSPYSTAPRKGISLRVWRASVLPLSF